MPTINNNLSAIAQSILAGERSLDADTAKELISSTTADGRIYRDEELRLLEQIESAAPSGSVYGRELLKEFIKGGEGRLLSKKRSAQTSPMANIWGLWRQFNPFLPKFSVPEPTFASTEKGAEGNFLRSLEKQTEDNVRKELTGERALEDLASQFEGATTRVVGWTRNKDVPKDDVYQVYLDQVKDQPINEHNPLGAVEAYLEANYPRS